MVDTTRKLKCELYNDNFQNFKRYGIQKAQLEYNKFRYYLRKFDMPIKIRLEDERVHLYKEWSNN